jgi:uncharacterized protein with FMN-binding domain
MTSSFRTPTRKTALIAVAGLGVLGATLAGCSTSTPATSTGGSSSGAASSGSSSSSSSSGTGTTASVDYKDGSYTEQGTYSSPGGQELISVSLTLKKNIVTAVTVKTIKADPTATGYEKMFEAGIGKVVTGKNINALNVTRVAGSSLTSQGFDDALTKIKADAKS